MIYKREEFFEENEQDQKCPVKQIEQLSSLDGSVKKFIGRVSLGVQTPMGVQTIPVTFEIEAATVQDAFVKFGARAETEVEAAKRELQNELNELRRRSQNRIVTPGDLPPPELGNFGGGMGKLKL